MTEEKKSYQWLKDLAATSPDRRRIADWAHEMAVAYLQNAGSHMNPQQAGEAIKQIFAAVSELFGQN